MTHWKKLTNPNYLGSYSFQPGEEKILTIVSVAEEEVNSPDGTKENCIVASLENEKPLILNKTNCKIIEKMTGTPYLEEWKGKSVIACVQKVRAFGEVVDAVRIRPMKPTMCAECGKPIRGYANLNHNQVREKTTKEYGRALCAECAIQEKKKADP